MDQYPLAESFKFGARENRMTPNYHKTCWNRVSSAIIRLTSFFPVEPRIADRIQLESPAASGGNARGEIDDFESALNIPLLGNE